MDSFFYINRVNNALDYKYLKFVAENFRGAELEQGVCLGAYKRLAVNLPIIETDIIGVYFEKIIYSGDEDEKILIQENSNIIDYLRS